MRISVITVCLNSEKTIEQTIQSVISQGYTDLEYIIIDGKSTDRTMDIVERYKDKLAMVISEPDDGLYYAMNKGISLATGDLIGIINSDDWYEPHTFELVKRHFDKFAADVLYGQMNMIGEKGIESVSRPDDVEKIRYRMVLNHPTVFIKKTIYEKYGSFNVNYRICADFELLIRLYTQGIKFHYIEKILANYRTNGLSSTYGMQNIEDTYSISMNYLELAPIERQTYYREKIEHEYKAMLFGYMLNRKTEELFITIKKYMDTEERKSITIWGTGKWGRRLCEILLGNGVEPAFLTDNNQMMWESEVSGIRVVPPHVLEAFEGVVLAVVRDYSEQILEQVKEFNNPLLKCIRWEQFV